MLAVCMQWNKCLKKLTQIFFVSTVDKNQVTINKLAKAYNK
jgi:hypothetical protein